MHTDIIPLVAQLSGVELQENAFKISDILARIGTEDVVTAMCGLLTHPNPESRIIAARTLGLIENNHSSLPALLEAIKDKENIAIAGDLLTALDGYDVAESYVEIFKLYLFGGYRVSMMAKELLDFKEFDITPRVLKKVMKHWDHYVHNVRNDEAFELRKVEVEEMLADIRTYLDETNSD